MNKKEWRTAFVELARLAGTETVPPSGWPERERSARHVCRLLASMLDASDVGEPRRELARAYARAFGLFVEAARRHQETQPPPAE